ncbi:MAG: hypothetical protein NTY22_02160 [Proteobacteria bacterium]|nr:hypothetical protein [Pseudomonadota bacterium]
MYVIAILFLIIGSVNSTAVDLLKTYGNTSNTQQTAAADVVRQYNGLEQSGIDPSKCGSWSVDRNNAYSCISSVSNRCDNTPVKGSCANPSIGQSLQAQIDAANKIKNDSEKKKQLKAIKSNVKSNCDKCKTFTSSKSALEQILNTVLTLADLYQLLKGTPPDTTTPTTYLTCSEKCKDSAGNADDYKACLCATSQTLSDGSTQSCMTQNECTADTSCAATVALYKKNGYCNGTDCDDLEKSCGCQTISTTTGTSMVWDSAAGKCVPSGTGDNPTDTIKYTNQTTTTTIPPTTPTTPDDTKTTSPVGTGVSGGPSIGAPGSGTDKLAAPKGKETAKFTALSKGGTGQYKNTPPQVYGSGGSADTTAEGSSSSAKPLNDIAKETSSDIWKIIRDIYQSGIDANRFMGPGSIADLNKGKGNIKKGTKKVKGSKA